MKKTYRVIREFGGYVRGWETRMVEAESEEEDIDHFWDGQEMDKSIVRDDTSTTDMKAEEL